MKPVLLIAWREFKQYVFSRGFLLFLVLMPLGAIFIGATVAIAERAKPARSFVIYDETGVFAGAISEELDWRRRKDTVAAFDAWVELAAEETALDESLIREPFAPAPLTRARIAAFFAAGMEAGIGATGPHLRAGAPPFEAPRWPFEEAPLPVDIAAATSVEDAAARARPYLLDEKRLPDADQPLFAAILIPQGFGAGEDAPPAQFWSRNVTDTALKSAIGGALSQALRRDAAEGLGLSADALDEVADIDAAVADFRPDRSPEDAELSQRDRIEIALPAFMTYMLIVVIFGAGNLLLTNTIEERSNKIVEVLLSSVTADQLMMGKLLGIAAVGLTLPAIFATTAVVAALGMGGGGPVAEALGTLAGSGLVFVYLFYFFCAYVIFAMIFLAIGAVSNSLQDAQSFMSPVMLIVFLPLPFMVLVYQNPNGFIASLLTWIPIYTPYAVMMRAASDPPLWEIVGATCLMLAFAVVLTRAMGRIFREAILNAAPAKIGDVLKMLRGGKR